MAGTDIKEAVKEKYGQTALRVKSGRASCCDTDELGCNPITSDLALGIALLSLARTSAAQFVPASPPIADPADTRFKGVSEDWRVTILNLPVLPLKLMIRKSHIPRIANDIDYFSISWVKILVRLYNSWASVYV